MGLFDIFKKKETPSEGLRLPEGTKTLTAKLLFNNEPGIDAERIAAAFNPDIRFELKLLEDGGILFMFLDVKFELEGVEAAMGCTLLKTTNWSKPIQIPDTVFQQNWEWPEGNQVAQNCKYELLIADMLGIAIEPAKRAQVFGSFLIAVIKALKPQAVCSLTAEKLINPDVLINDWQAKDQRFLTGLCNVRLFRIEASATNEVLMDTLGLTAFGLPDFQIVFTNIQQSRVAGFLWSYAYYVFEKGDVIADGNTVEGIDEGAKWKCHLRQALAAPDRITLQIFPE